MRAELLLAREHTAGVRECGDRWLNECGRLLPLEFENHQRLMARASLQHNLKAPNEDTKGKEFGSAKQTHLRAKPHRLQHFNNLCRANCMSVHAHTR